MSIKSLLQLILLLLIFIILGSIYFIYFYSGPLKKEILNSDLILSIDDQKLSEKNLQDNEILEEFKSDKENLKEMDQGNDINIGISKTNIEEENLSKKNVNLSTNSEYKKRTE